MREPTPFELGWAAGLAGEDPRLCPFDKMTKECREWQSAHGKATDYVRFAAQPGYTQYTGYRP